jgi:hypothetical protein
VVGDARAHGIDRIDEYLEAALRCARIAPR